MRIRIFVERYDSSERNENTYEQSNRPAAAFVIDKGREALQHLP